MITNKQQYFSSFYSKPKLKQQPQNTINNFPPPAPYLTHSSSDSSLKNDNNHPVQLQNKLFPKKFEKSDSTSHLHRLEALRLKYQNGTTLKTSKTDTQLLPDRSSTLPRPLPEIPHDNPTGTLNESFTKALQNLQHNQTNFKNRKIQPKIGTNPVYRKVLPTREPHINKYPPSLQAMHNKHSIQPNRKQVNHNNKPCLKLGNSVAHSYGKRKNLVERGQLAGLQLNSKLHEYVKHQDKLLCNEQELSSFEQFVVRLEQLSVGDIVKIDETMVERIKRQEQEIEQLKNEKAALLDKVFKQGLNDTNATFLD